MTVLGILFVLLGAVIFREKNSDIIESWMIVSWVALSIMIAVYVGATMWTHYADIENEDFLVVTGEFEKDHTRDFIFVNDEKSTRLINTDRTFLNTGHYSGRIIYSKRTKYVLGYLLDSGENASAADDSAVNYFESTYDSSF